MSWDEFIVTDNGLMYTPTTWYGRDGYFRSARTAFILVSYCQKYRYNEHGHPVAGWSVPLNHVNLEDILVKLPDFDVTNPPPQVHKIVRRAFELEVRRAAFQKAESFKLAQGLEEKQERKYFVFDDDGNGVDPFYKEGPVEKMPGSLHWDLEGPSGWKFYYQQRALLDLVNVVPSALVAMQQRTGKTDPMVVHAKLLKERGDIDLVVVVATKRLLHTAWTDQLNLHWPKSERLILVSREDREYLFTDEYDVLLTSFESLHKNWAYIRKLYNTSRICLIADETIKIKSPTSRRTRALWAACSEAGYRYLLSGAPVSRLHSDIFPQMMCVDPGLFGDSYKAARDYFFETYGFGNLRFKRNKKHLFHAICDYGVWRCTRGESEQFQGRETLTVNERIPFHPLQAEIYRQLALNFWAEVATADFAVAIEVQNILVKLGRLREICGGFTSYEYAPGKYARIRLPVNPKLDWLRQWLDEHEGTPAIVFCEYTEEEHMICDLLEELGITYGGIEAVRRERSKKIRNGNADEQFASHMHEFQAGERLMFVGKHSSIGHGLTLNAADAAIFYSIGFNSDNYDQARVRGVGSDGKVVLVYHLLMGGSLEETQIYEALRKRQDMKALIMRDGNRRGYENVFREMSEAELLIDESLHGELLEDLLEKRARDHLNFHGPLTEDALEAHFNSSGHSMFTLVKKTIGACTSLKEAYKKCMLAFHPDRAIAQGYDRGSSMYIMFNDISVAANKAMTDKLSLGEFVGLIGGKEPSVDEQKWYDYLLRKARAIAGINGREPVSPERMIE